MRIWIDHLVDHGNIQSVALEDRLPIRQTRPAERINANLDPRIPDRRHIDHIRQIVHIRLHQVLRLCGARGHGPRKRHALHLGIMIAQQLVGPVLHPLRDVHIRRSAAGCATA